MKLPIACAIAIAASTTSPASADETTAAAFSHAPATVVSDPRLATLRGKFVPSASAALAPGTVVYFGLDMTTNWTTPDATNYAADVTLRLGVSGAGQPVLSIATGSVEHAGTRAVGTATHDSGTIVGAAPGGAGLVQAIQIAGNGNVVDNRASLTLTQTIASADGSIVSPTRSCAACSFTAGPAGIGLSIAIPGGNAASQLVGPGGVAQTARVISNGNTVMNDLHLVLGVAPDAPGAAPVFHPSPLQLVPLPVIR